MTEHIITRPQKLSKLSSHSSEIDNLWTSLEMEVTLNDEGQYEASETSINCNFSNLYPKSYNNINNQHVAISYCNKTIDTRGPIQQRPRVRKESEILRRQRQKMRRKERRREATRQAIEEDLKAIELAINNPLTSRHQNLIPQNQDVSKSHQSPTIVRVVPEELLTHSALSQTTTLTDVLSNKCQKEDEAKDARKPALITLPSPTVSWEHLVVFLANRLGGQVTSEEAQCIHKHVIDQMKNLNKHPLETNIQIINSGIVPPNFFLLNLANKESHHWFLTECPPYQEGDFVAKPIEAEEAPWPAIISFGLKNQQKVDVPELLKRLDLQNRAYQINRWTYLSMNGQPGSWNLKFQIPGDLLSALKNANWRLYYRLMCLSIQYDFSASKALRQQAFGEMKHLEIGTNHKKGNFKELMEDSIVPEPISSNKNMKTKSSASEINRKSLVHKDSPTVFYKYQVAFLSNRPGGDVTEKEGKHIQNHIVDALSNTSNRMWTNLLPTNMGVVSSHLFLITSDDKELYNWLLKDCSSYKDGGFVASPVSAKDILWPEVISFGLKKQEKPDIPELLKCITLQNRKYNIKNWRHLTTKGVPGNWELQFQVPRDVLPVLRTASWKLYYGLMSLNVQHVGGRKTLEEMTGRMQEITKSLLENCSKTVPTTLVEKHTAAPVSQTDTSKILSKAESTVKKSLSKVNREAATQLSETIASSNAGPKVRPFSIDHQKTLTIPKSQNTNLSNAPLEAKKPLSQDKRNSTASPSQLIASSNLVPKIERPLSNGVRTSPTATNSPTSIPINANILPEGKSTNGASTGGSSKYQVVFLANRPGGEVTKEEVKLIKKHVIKQMKNRIGTNIQFYDFGVVPPNFFLIIAGNDATYKWLLNECPSYKNGDFVASPVPAEDAPWPEIVTFRIKNEEKIDIPELMKGLAQQNRSYQIHRWRHVGLSGESGDWKLDFQIPGDILPVLKWAGWRLFYDTICLSVRYDLEASKALRQKTIEGTQHP
ncbi:uncharacterized protein LOC126742346 [Anthonomus grandis grandis]|uniref:uncharacterized protein LOC126742346 n=1 Tax=Anthonomus grandis grandis TaxID=2921223 RepID=UPI002165F44F|nr:uncharacterized protein LOC126742346 [Anthonomus grandis grandis]